MTLQELIFALQRFWADRGCLIGQPYDLEKGAGTMNPLTFFGALGSGPGTWPTWSPPPTGRRPLRREPLPRVQAPAVPGDPQAAPRRGAGHLHREPANARYRPSPHDLRFEEDNWESPTLGAWGVGWQVVLDGMEISQFTYFQQVGGLDCRPV